MTTAPPPASSRQRAIELMRNGQSMLCNAFETMDGAATFVSDTWTRPSGDGGTARILSDGPVFERAGVNVSAIEGDRLPPSVLRERPELEGTHFFVTGISMVLHPRNPYAPAFHANFRYFEAGPVWWFGGGMDMTPMYGFHEDAVHFHTTLKHYCKRHNVADYATLKKTCDEYFWIKHRAEMRGIGGLFFDTLIPPGEQGWEAAFAFVQDGISTIRDAYLPIVARRKEQPYGENERNWQLYRRGRYVEFNLVYDKGTAFGLQTGGYIEAILMSLPPLARWEYALKPESGTPEAETIAMLQPRDWAAIE